MKKIRFLIPAAVLLLLLPGRAQAAESAWEIHNRTELEAIGKNPSAHYRLASDIDLGETPWTPIPFSGSLEGQGHTLYNLTVREPGPDLAVSRDGNCLPYDTAYAALFSVTRNAEIRNLNILGADVQVETDQNCFAAILAGHLENTRIENCRVEGRVALYPTSKMAGTGGLAGFGRGTISSCSADVELIYGDRAYAASGIRCEQFLGGLLATGNSNLYDNTVNIRGYASCWGYAHNGGLNGMHYITDGSPNGEITGNSVTGFIEFFENNPDRRAYCQAYVGEAVPHPANFVKNKADFQRIEKYRQTEELNPERCEVPDYEITVQPHTDQDYGYTLHRCKGCGYTFQTDYTLPGHIPGEWEMVIAPNYETDGLRERRCTVCGAVMDQESIPRRVPSTEIRLSTDNLKLNYKDSIRLEAAVLPENAENREVIWNSSDESVATVTEDGLVTATGRGKALITCTSADGFSESACQVEAGCSFGQWLIMIFLFGWLWY